MRGSRRRWPGAWALALVLLASGAGWAKGSRGEELPRLAPPTAQDRVLVLAPHPDDETLGGGGLIQQALAVHAQVEVVIVTNGDGFRASAAQVSHDRRPTPGDYLRLGLRRQRESLAGLARLGVNEHQVIFLGYPDGGLVRMWLEYWHPDRPYTSTATQRNHCPYPGVFHPDAPYAGRVVVDDLVSIMRRFRPTLVALPHPGDRHPDHWSTYGYGTAALYELDDASKVRLLYYLVHRRGWSEPAPRRDPKPLRAPPDHFDTWKVLTLTPPQFSRQQQAVDCYRTQLGSLRNFMAQFLGQEQLLASVPWGELPRLPESADPGANRIRLLELPPAAQALPSMPAHIRTLRAALEGGKLHLLLELSEPVGGATSYRVYLHPLLHHRVGPPQEYVLDPAHAAPGVSVRAESHLLDAWVPWEHGAAGVMLAVEARTPGALPDRTRWVTLLGED